MSLLDIDYYRAQYSTEMESLRQQVTTGNRQALFRAIELYFRGVTMGIAGPCPDWLAGAAIIPFNEVAEGKHDHMEHAFGFTIKKQTQGSRSTRIGGKRVYEAVELAHHQGHAISHDGAFAVAGDQLGMSTSTVERRYRDYQKRLKSNSYDRSNELMDNYTRKHG